MQEINCGNYLHKCQTKLIRIISCFDDGFIVIFLEISQGTEITSVIHQWKEMNCGANAINTMDQSRMRDGKGSKAFWETLGGRGTIQGD